MAAILITADEEGSIIAAANALRKAWRNHERLKATGNELARAEAYVALSECRTQLRSLIEHGG